MQRPQLEHIIRAAVGITGATEIVVIGSQAVLGQFPDAPPALLASMEADVYPRNRPERADLIDGAIGEGSRFHEQFGYYAQGVGEATATLPRHWRNRLVRVKNANTSVVTIASPPGIHAKTAVNSRVSRRLAPPSARR